MNQKKKKKKIEGDAPCTSVPPLLPPRSCLCVNPLTGAPRQSSLIMHLSAQVADEKSLPPVSGRGVSSLLQHDERRLRAPSRVAHGSCVLPLVAATTAVQATTMIKMTVAIPNGTPAARGSFAGPLPPRRDLRSASPPNNTQNQDEIVRTH